MAIPSTAIGQPQVMDPKDIRDFLWNLGANVLQEGEAIDTGSADTTLVLGAEAVAAGLTLLTTGGYTIELGSNYLIVWVSIDPGMQNNAMFDNEVAMPLVFTFATTNVPPRRKQKTLVIRAKQQ